MMLNLYNAIEVYKNKGIKTSENSVVNAVSDIVAHLTELNPYMEQIKAATELYKGKVVEMATGEGKTLAILFATLLACRDNRKVYIVTSNDYLSKRDYESAFPVLDYLDLKAVFFSEGEGGTEDGYKDADVIYATGNTLIFDYLRGVKSDRDFVIIDEIDYVLVEQANHDFSVADGKSNVEMPENIFRKCKAIAGVFAPVEMSEQTKKAEYLFDLQHEYDCIIDVIKSRVEMTNRGFNKMLNLSGHFDLTNERLYATEIMIATLYAKYILKRDVDYIVSNNEIVIIDSSSGRISPNGRNDVFVHTALEVKEDVPITAKAFLNSSCSFPVFFKTFKTLTGISGTASLAKLDLERIFEKDIVKVPPHLPCQRKEYYKYYENDEMRLLEIYNIVSASKFPVLIITDSDDRTMIVMNALKNRLKRKIEALDNRNLDDENGCLARLKQGGVLVSSKIVGRGTDVSIEGLVVVIAQRFLSRRAERQAIGRTGRQGMPGECYVMTSQDDDIFKLENRRKLLMNERTVRRMQDRYENRMFEVRKHIYVVSKLFFDQDQAIRSTIEGWDSYQDILDKTKNSRVEDVSSEKLYQNTVNLLNAAVKYNFEYGECQRKVLLKLYEQTKPFFQQQFLAYSNNMAMTLYSNDGFNDRCKEYVVTGQKLLLQTIYCFLLPIVQTNRKEHNGKLQSRKSSIPKKAEDSQGCNGTVNCCGSAELRI